LIYADLHIHTKYSVDSSIDPRLLVEQVHSHVVIKAVAVTDHGTIEGYLKVKALAAPYEDVLIVPGMEITTDEGDLIVLGIAEPPPKPWDVEGIIDFSKRCDGLVIAAHPFRDYGIGERARIYPLDAVEVLNRGTLPHLNRLAMNLARETGLPGVAGSDAHRPEELWSVGNEIDASLDVSEILGAIRKGFVKASSFRKSIRF
jgi:predicted metal-dependent phosphoesterase TrpH